MKTEQQIRQHIRNLHPLPGFWNGFVAGLKYVLGEPHAIGDYDTPEGYTQVDEPVAGDFAECNGVMTELQPYTFQVFEVNSRLYGAVQLRALGFRFYRKLTAQPEPEPEWEALPAGTEPEEGDQADFNGERFEVFRNREGDLCVKVPCAWADSVCTVEFAARINAKFYRRHTPKPSVSEEFEGVVAQGDIGPSISVRGRNLPTGTRVTARLAEPLAGGEGM